LQSLQPRLIGKTGIHDYHLLIGNADPAAVTHLAGEAIALSPIDVAFVGIGENGHLAFNDPPADFQTEEPYIIVHLDEACRQQQVGEGWFQNLSDVSQQAISMSIRQILKSREILCIVPDARKARAIPTCFDGEISPQAPASILRTHPYTIVYLDQKSAGLLSPGTISCVRHFDMKGDRGASYAWAGLWGYSAQQQLNPSRGIQKRSPS
jgi:glucosamine-6-phosphate deaminase